MEPTNKLPLVSILIPTHERPYYFSLALASAITQTYENIEVIISDNSNDNETELIVNDFQKKYSNIKYFHTPGLDMHSNWQKCWDNISEESEYVNFLMDDDIFAQNKIEIMVDHFLKYPDANLVTSYRMLIDKDDNPLPDRGFNAPIVDNDSVIKGSEAGKNFLLRCVNWIGEPTTVLFKKSATNNFFRGWTGQEKYLILDYPLWLRLMETGSIVYLTQTLSFFRQHEVNDSKNFKTQIMGSISMALMIQHAWNNKIYLQNETDIKQALVSWQKMSLGTIHACFYTNYEGEDFDDLLNTYRVMCTSFTQKQTEEIHFDF